MKTVKDVIKRLFSSMTKDCLGRRKGRGGMRKEREDIMRGR